MNDLNGWGIRRVGSIRDGILPVHHSLLLHEANGVMPNWEMGLVSPYWQCTCLLGIPRACQELLHKQRTMTEMHEDMTRYLEMAKASWVAFKDIATYRDIYNNEGKELDEIKEAVKNQVIKTITEGLTKDLLKDKSLIKSIRDKTVDLASKAAYKALLVTKEEAKELFGVSANFLNYHANTGALNTKMDCKVKKYYHAELVELLDRSNYRYYRDNNDL